jgi:VWFA-related protein
MRIQPTCLLSVCLLTFLASGPAVSQLTSAPPADPASSAPAGTSSPQPPAAPPASNAPPQLTTPPSAPGTQPAAPYTIRANVPLVILDVVVTDAKGKPILSLNRSSFHVQESDEPQSILNFEAAGARMPNPALTINSTADLDRLAPQAPVQIILLDEFNTRFEDMAFARYSLKKFLQRQPDKLATPTLLLAVSLTKFEVLHDYTQDKSAIIQSLDHHFVAYPWQAHQFAWVGERYSLAFITLRRVAQAVVGHPGHKNMIWIGRGFPPFFVQNVPVDTQHRIDTAVQDCVNTLRDARVTLYTVDPAGLMIDPGKYGSAAAFNDPFGGNYQFSSLARATGGTALYGRNDVDTEIDSAIQDGASFYTLTYRPTNTSRDPQQFRKIKVSVDDLPGAKIFTRQGYYLQYGPGKVDPNNLSRRLATDLLAADTSTMTYDGVPITVSPVADEPNKFLLHIEPRGLVWTVATDTEPRHADFILMVSIFDKKGAELHRDARIYKIPATGDVPPNGRLDRALDLRYELERNPKAVRARFTVRVSATGRIGAVDAALSQPPRK